MLIRGLSPPRCCALLLAAFLIPACSALLSIQVSPPSSDGRWSGVVHGAPQRGPAAHQATMAPGDKLNLSASFTEEGGSLFQEEEATGEDGKEPSRLWRVHTDPKDSHIFMHGRSLVEEGSMASVNSDKKGTARLAKMNASFKAALENPIQVSKNMSSHYTQMQAGTCRVLWGKKEMVTKHLNRSLIAKSLNLFSACPETKFTSTDGGQTHTWRECANKLSSNSRFFSWVRSKDSQTGTCTLIGVASTSVTETDVANCLKDAKAEEVAVSGYAADAYCTSCAVGDWTTTDCSTWCEGGMMASDIQQAKHYCPDAENQSNRRTETWQECSKACECGFLCFYVSLYDEVASTAILIQLHAYFLLFELLWDPSTFTDASCFRYSFHNTTSTCEFKPLGDCDNTATTTDALWISGDVLSMPDPDYSTVTWSSWSPWSSCEGIDATQGWKKRRRGVANWGFRNDGLMAESKLVEVASCTSSGGVVQSQAATEALNSTCCLFGEWPDWSEVECDPVCGTDRYQIRRKRRLQNPVPDAHNQFDPTCSEDKCKAEAERAESRKCIDVSECTSDCVYLDWTPWSTCTCADSSTGSGMQARTRKAVSGTICPDMKEQQTCTAASCTGESSTMTYVYVASGGVGGLLLVFGLCVYCRQRRGQGEPAVRYETL
ncbi:hypothetical protein Emed_003376 [Eimeria media]